MKRLLLLLVLPFAAGISGCCTRGVPSEDMAGAASTARIAVKGMHCEICSGSVTSFLKKVDGVTGVYVSVPSGVALARLDPAKPVSDDVLKKAVYDAGFEATGITRTSGDYAKAVAAMKAADAAK